MKGTAQKMINHLIETRSKGNPTLVINTKTRLILKGIDPAKFTGDTPDEPNELHKIQQLASEWGIQL